MQLPSWRPWRLCAGFIFTQVVWVLRDCNGMKLASFCLARLRRRVDNGEQRTICGLTRKSPSVRELCCSFNQHLWQRPWPFCQPRGEAIFVSRSHPLLAPSWPLPSVCTPWRGVRLIAATHLGATHWPGYYSCFCLEPCSRNSLFRANMPTCFTPPPAFPSPQGFTKHICPFRANRKFGWSRGSSPGVAVAEKPSRSFEMRFCSGALCEQPQLGSDRSSGRVCAVWLCPPALSTLAGTVLSKRQSHPDVALFELLYVWVIICLGFPSGSDDKESACQCRGPGFDPWVRKIPWRRKWQPTPVFLPGESHRQRSLVGYSPWGHRVGHD